MVREISPETVRNTWEITFGHRSKITVYDTADVEHVFKNRPDAYAVLHVVIAWEPFTDGGYIYKVGETISMADVTDYFVKQRGY